MKKNIRGFSGFTFGEDSADKKKKVEKLTKYGSVCFSNHATLFLGLIPFVKCQSSSHCGL